LNPEPASVIANIPQINIMVESRASICFGVATCDCLVNTTSTGANRTTKKRHLVSSQL